jgi:hypothetical protein
MPRQPNDRPGCAHIDSLLLYRGKDVPEKALSIAALFISIELVIFKFLPDVGTAVIQNSKSALTDFAAFEQYYFTPGTVHYARFLGNRILLVTAYLLAHLFQSEDVRLHPLRIAAGLVTPVYAYLGVILAIQTPAQYSWRYFIVMYSIAAVMGLYVFYPGDMPSFALLSITLFLILREQLGLALLFALLTGLFRESSLHAVFFVFVWALCVESRPISARVAWVMAFAAGFAGEYLAIRYFFAGPVSSTGGFILDPRRLFLERGMYSLTTLCSLGLALIFAAGGLVRLKHSPSNDWRWHFFRLNCFAFPLWIVFYRILGGNISEFRLMWPVILPCIYAVAYCGSAPYAANDTLFRRTAAVTRGNHGRQALGNHESRALERKCAGSKTSGSRGCTLRIVRTL